MLATGALVSGLPAIRALLAFATHQFLGLRARLRPPLLPRLGRTHRRRPRARARVLAYLFLQSLQTILVLRKPVRELNDELDAHLTPRVINRLLHRGAGILTGDLTDPNYGRTLGCKHKIPAHQRAFIASGKLTT